MADERQEDHLGGDTSVIDESLSGAPVLDSGGSLACSGCLLVAIVFLALIAMTTPMYARRWRSEISWDQLNAEFQHVVEPTARRIGTARMTGYPNATNNCGKAIHAEWDPVSWSDAFSAMTEIVASAEAGGYVSRPAYNSDPPGHRARQALLERRVGDGYRQISLSIAGAIAGPARISIFMDSNCYPGYMLPLYT